MTNVAPCTQPLICPVCRAALEQTNRSLQCIRQHSFDLAREGYVNLLSGRKRPGILGDAKEMVRARHHFLAAGHYEPLSDAVNNLIASHLSDSETAIVDAGCGEGYYLRRLASYLAEEASHSQICYFGLDLSRDAIRLAAQQTPHMRFVVADINQLVPFGDGSVSSLINIFAPRNVAEYDRVLAADGSLVVVIPSADHLNELRQELDLLAIEEDKQHHVMAQFSQFELTEAITIAYPLHLSAEALLGLIGMTPNYWHMDDAGWAAAAALGDFETTAAFNLLLFRR